MSSSSSSSPQPRTPTLHNTTPPKHNNQNNSFLTGTDEDRLGTFKIIPHIADGSWVIRQSVGTTPVMLGRKLGTSFYVTDRYVEVTGWWCVV